MILASAWRLFLLVSSKGVPTTGRRVTVRDKDVIKRLFEL
jgi:hypothetical protein